MSRQISKVYVVDDDDAVRDSLVALIESHGLDVEVFQSGDEFLSRVSPASRGCLLLDLHLPIMGGLEVLSALRSKGIGIPVILITGGGDGTMATRARQIGAWLVMEKPLNYKELLDNIARALHAR